MREHCNWVDSLGLAGNRSPLTNRRLARMSTAGCMLISSSSCTADAHNFSPSSSATDGFASQRASDGLKWTLSLPIEKEQADIWRESIII
jgi:hypothetical protein